MVFGSFLLCPPKEKGQHLVRYIFMQVERAWLVLDTDSFLFGSALLFFG